MGQLDLRDFAPVPEEDGKFYFALVVIGLANEKRFLSLELTVT